MNVDDLPADVLRFIEDNIDSVPHLEALLLLYEQPEQQWTTAVVAERLYVTRAAAAALLADLERRKLAEKKADADSPTYIYAGAWDPGGEMMRKVAVTYRRNLTRVAVCIHSKASRSVREFARAFDLKKDP
jgi:DNA-binding MarR family transcriptional regulator